MSSERTLELEAQLSSVRGRLIASYSFIEFTLGDLAVKCSRLPEYEQAARGFPVNLWERMTAVRALLSMPGPLQAYREELEENLGTITEFVPTRHILAHGHSRLTVSPSEHWLVFSMYEKGHDREWRLIRHEMKIEDLRCIYARLDPYATKMHAIFKKIYLELGLEERGS